MTRARSKDIETEAKSPDAFLTLSERGLKWIESNARAVGSMALLAFLSGGAWAAYQSWISRSEETASAALHVFEAEWEKMEGELAARTKSKDSDPLAAAETSWDESTKAKAEELTGRWLNELRKHKGKVAVSLSAMELADNWSKRGNPERALAAIEAGRGSRSMFLNSMLELQLAGILLDLKQWDKAVQAYSTVLNNKEVAFAHDLALLRQGLAYAELGEAERAKSNWQRIQTEFSESEASGEAKTFMRLQKLKESDTANTKTPKG